MTEDVFSHQEDLMDGTWKKLERDLQKDGFREGALKGQEGSFQTGFNFGYPEGYRIGEALGFYKGLLRSCIQLNLDKPKLSHCQKHLEINEMDNACILCKDNDLSATNCLKDIIEHQRIKNIAIINDIS